MAVASPQPPNFAAPPTGAPPASAVPRSVRWLPPLLRPTFEELLPRTRTERTRRDWWFDAIAIFISVTAGLGVHVAAKDAGSSMHGLREVVDLASLPVAALSLLWRRRWPLQIAFLTGTLTLIAPSTGIASAFAAFAVAAYAPPTTALIGLGFLVATSPPSSYFARSTTEEVWWSGAIFGVIATIGIGAWGMFTGTRRQLLVTLHERARRAEAEQALRINQAREQERTRIAREMHDVLAHRMSLLSVHAGALEFRPDARPEEVARAAGVIRQTAHEALEELRTVIGVLRVGEVTGASVPESPQPTLAVVPTLVADWREAGARIDLEVAIDPEAVPDAIGRTAYRVVQEGLTNATKHAPAARIAVRITGEPGSALVVEVSNPLVAGAPASEIPGTGVGLVGLRERTELAGGGLHAAIDPARRQFLLRATLPWSAA
jgi:signal transduction histidine kinase